jgi:hypothetical protein
MATNPILIHHIEWLPDAHIKGNRRTPKMPTEEATRLEEALRQLAGTYMRPDIPIIHKHFWVTLCGDDSYVSADKKGRKILREALTGQRLDGQGRSHEISAGNVVRLEARRTRNDDLRSR